jgi:hypothetical protein
MVSSSLWILIDKQIYSRRNEDFGNMDKFLSYEGEQFKNVSALGFAICPRLNQAERQPIPANHDETNY